MTDHFIRKQIRCTHCEFEFTFSGFGSVAMTVCPACGEGNALPAVPPAVPQNTPSPEPIPDSPASPTPVTNNLLCSVEHCPLLSGGESGEAVARQLGLQLRKKRSRRQTILAWTVMLQVCILLGAGLFVARTPFLPEMSPLHQAIEPQPIADNAPKQENETAFPFAAFAQSVPFAGEETYATAIDAKGDPEAYLPPELGTAFDDPFAHASMPDFAVSPFEAPHDTFHMPMPVELAIDSLPEPPPLAQPATASVYGEADELLAEAQSVLTTEPETSLAKALQAAKLYRQQGQPMPDLMYWILGNAFTALSWGEPLLESSPVIKTMTLSPDNRYLLAQLQDQTVWLWDLQNSEEDRSGHLLDSGRAEYVKFVFTQNLRWVIGGQTDGTIRIWDMYLKNPAAATVTFTETIPGLQDLQISPNGQWLAAFGNAPHNAALADAQLPEQLIQQVSFQRESINRQRHSGDSSSNVVLLWNLRQMGSGVVPKAVSVPSMSSHVTAMQFCPNSNRIAVGRRDATVRIYDLTDRMVEGRNLAARGIADEAFILQGHQLAITQIAFAPSGQWVATGSQDNTVRLWSLANSKMAPDSVTLYGHLGWISALTVDALGERVYSGSYDRTIRIWKVQRERIASALNAEPTVLDANLGILHALLLTKDGEKLVARGGEGGLAIFHLPSLSSDESFLPIRFRHSRLSIDHCLLTSDDQMLIFSYEHLSNSSNSGIRLWPLQTQTFVQDTEH
ncbi:MAG: hypothetical protein FWG73_03940 [Planctomycetaceae bacterium]|nr:hypothetical protein [Planctomycetaceae bacterium]